MSKKPKNEWTEEEIYNFFIDNYHPTKKWEYSYVSLKAKTLYKYYRDPKEKERFDKANVDEDNLWHYDPTHPIEWVILFGLFIGGIFLIMYLLLNGFMILGVLFFVVAICWQGLTKA